MNVSIIGSCQSRDIFNSSFIPNYKEYFQVYSYFTMTSMLSVMSEPVTYNYHKLIQSGLNDNQMEHWYYELEKPILKTLESKQPDILLMDFYADARYGARAYGSEYVVNRLFKLKEKDIIDWNKLGIVYSYEHNTEDFITMWKNAFDRFMSFMQEKLPDTMIVINTIKGTNMVTDAKGTTYISPSLQEIELDKINGLWELFDNYAIQKYNLKAITYSKQYTMNPEYPFGGLGVALVHFHKEYYEDCFEGLLQVTKDSKAVVGKECHFNLVSDSAYKNQLNYWSHLCGKYRVLEHTGYRSICAKDCRKVLGDYRPQVWSRPIEIEGSGTTSYTLSFYIKIPNLKRFKENSVLFGIRTFKYMQEIKAGKCIDSYSLTMAGHEIKENEEYRYVFTFTPKGKFLKLAPFMFHYIPGVEYSRIKLERSSSASKYTK